MNQEKIQYYINKINKNTNSIPALLGINQELSQMGLLNVHPHVLYYIAFMLWQHGLHSEARSNFLNVISLEIELDYQNYGTIYSDSIGISISFLMDKYKDKFQKNTADLFQMGYSYLSKHIEIGGIEMCDSYKYRAYLSDNYSNHASHFALQRLNRTTFVSTPLTISDYFYSCKGYLSNNLNDQVKESMERAKYLHGFLEDITINGKDADEYSLAEITAIGGERNDEITKSIINLDFVNPNNVLASLVDIVKK